MCYKYDETSTRNPRNSFTRKKVFLEKDIKRKEKQKAIVQAEIKKGFKSSFAS